MLANSVSLHMARKNVFTYVLTYLLSEEVISKYLFQV